MILNMASAAPPLNPVFHAWTDAVVGNVTKRFNIVCVTYHVTMIRWHTAIGLQNCLVVRLRIHLRNNQGMLKEEKKIEYVPSFKIPLQLVGDSLAGFATTSLTLRTNSPCG